MSTDHVVHAGSRLGHRYGGQGGRGAATAEHVSESERLLLGLMVVHRRMGTTVGLLLLLMVLLLLLQHLVWWLLMMLLLLLVLVR